MSPIEHAVLAERTFALERHLARVAQKLPPGADGFLASSDALRDTLIAGLALARRATIAT